MMQHALSQAFHVTLNVLTAASIVFATAVVEILGCWLSVNHRKGYLAVCVIAVGVIVSAGVVVSKLADGIHYFWYFYCLN